MSKMLVGLAGLALSVSAAAGSAAATEAPEAGLLLMPRVRTNEVVITNDTVARARSGAAITHRRIMTPGRHRLGGDDLTIRQQCAGGGATGGGDDAALPRIGGEVAVASAAYAPGQTGGVDTLLASAAGGRESLVNWTLR
jgi:hypothetical protein